MFHLHADFMAIKMELNPSCYVLNRYAAYVTKSSAVGSSERTFFRSSF